MFGYRRVACSARWVALRSGPGYVRGRTRREPWEGGLKRVGLERMCDLSVWGLRVEAWRRWRGLRTRHRCVDESCGIIWRGSRVVDILSAGKGGGGRDDCYTDGGRAIICGGNWLMKTRGQDAALRCMSWQSSRIETFRDPLVRLYIPAHTSCHLLETLKTLVSVFRTWAVCNEREEMSVTSVSL